MEVRARSSTQNVVLPKNSDANAVHRRCNSEKQRSRIERPEESKAPPPPQSQDNMTPNGRSRHQALRLINLSDRIQSTHGHMVFFERAPCYSRTVSSRFTPPSPSTPCEAANCWVQTRSNLVTAVSPLFSSPVHFFCPPVCTMAVLRPFLMGTNNSAGTEPTARDHPNFRCGRKSTTEKISRIRSKRT